MLNVRVIPCLLLRNKGLVKGVNFKNHRYVGDPINAVKIFNEKEVDELMFLDISATRENREPDYDYIREIASQAFMPLAYGGGVCRIEDAASLFRLGVEKIVVNIGAAKEILTTVAKGKFLNAINIETKAINPAKHLLK